MSAVTEIASRLSTASSFFNGPEKTLALCFRSRRLTSRSLRLTSQETWEKILHTKGEVLSSIESTPAVVSPKQKDQKDKPVNTGGVTAYLFSESSLFVSDATLVLKTCGATTPLTTLEALLDLATPTWRSKTPEHYLEYAIYSSMGDDRPEEQLEPHRSWEQEQLEPHRSWEQEVEFLGKHFRGESVSLGTAGTSAQQQYIFVANYLPRDEVSEVFSTQVVMKNLNTEESMQRFVESSALDKSLLRTQWADLHGQVCTRQSIAANATFDERFFDSSGYASNAIFGKYFTTMHVAPQPGRSYLSLKTSMPVTREARERFVQGSLSLCSCDTLSLSEFALTSKFFLNSQAPTIPGFELRRSTSSIGSSFACAHHHYERMSSLLPMQLLPLLRQSSDSSITTEAALLEEEGAEAPGLAKATIPELEVCEQSLAPAQAAEHFLSQPGNIPHDAPVALLDCGALRQQAELWHRLLPRVEPFYAVKCNPHPKIVETLQGIWREKKGGFDCASRAEIELALAQGVDPARNIIFANPCKQVSAVEYARAKDVRQLVFDNPAELDKIAGLFPEADLVLRIQTDDSKAQCPLSSKFGAAVADCGGLLRKAKDLGLKVTGVSFHVGSRCSERGAFKLALQDVRLVFDEARSHGYELTLLDIGGGFPGWDEEGQATFADHAEEIRMMLEELFPSPEIRVIAEPGRFFVATAQAILTTVISVAEVSGGRRYYLNDGVYGSFNNLVHDQATVAKPTILRDGKVWVPSETELKEGSCTLFGPTCDGFDTLTESLVLPHLKVGDKLLFPDMGAYTNAAGSTFNGFAPVSFVLIDSGPKALFV